jgi:hypothetical protein
MAFWGRHGIDPEVLNILANLDTQEPTLTVRASAGSMGLVAFSAANLQVLDWALTDTGPWAIKASFVRDTEDGELETAVYSEVERASVVVTLKRKADASVATLAYHEYLTTHPGVAAGRKVSPADVNHVRKWLRTRSLAGLEAEKTRRAAATNQQASEIEALRRKYLP